MSKIEVIRGGQHLYVDGDFYFIADLLSVLDFTLKDHVKYPHQYRPPVFRTGTPYGQLILDFKLMKVAKPAFFRSEYVPASNILTSVGRGRAEVWSKVFGIDPKLHYKDLW